MNKKHSQGFTLIELSIVLVIIGLIVGGILVGRDLVQAAHVRAQISQIEKFNQAVNTFYGKYQALPGDMPAAVANQFGFTPRGQYAGEGDGNGVLQGVWRDLPGNNMGVFDCNGETCMFWVDLSMAHLIEGSFTTATATNMIPVDTIAASSIPLYLPPAKLGNDNYIYVWSGGWKEWATAATDGINYFGLSAMTEILPLFSASGGGDSDTRPNIPVIQAYNIDKIRPCYSNVQWCVLCLGWRQRRRRF